MRNAKVVLVVVDVCLMAYWAATAMHLIPADRAFKDYEDATIQAWNWSFLPPWTPWPRHSVAGECTSSAGGGRSEGRS